MRSSRPSVPGQSELGAQIEGELRQVGELGWDPVEMRAPRDGFERKATELHGSQGHLTLWCLQARATDLTALRSAVTSC